LDLDLDICPFPKRNEIGSFFDIIRKSSL